MDDFNETLGFNQTHSWWSAASSLDRFMLLLNFFYGFVSIGGISMNALTFVMFFRKRLAAYSYAFYSKVKIISDTVVLVHSLKTFPHLRSSLNFETSSANICKLSQYTYHVASSFSLWLLGLMLFDRYFSVAYSAKYFQLKKAHFRIGVCFVALVYPVCLYYPILVHSSIKNHTTHAGDEVIECTNDRYNSIFIYWIKLCDFLVEICVVNNLLTYLTIFHMLKKRKRSSCVGIERNSRVLARDRKFALNSILLNILCIMCKSPIIIVLIVTKYVDVAPDVAQIMILLANLVFISESGSSLLINIVANDSFRKEFKQIIYEIRN